MHRPGRLRGRLVTILAGTLVVAAVGIAPAGAEVASYRGEAVGTGIDLSLLDTAGLSGATSEATITSAPQAVATGVGIDQLEQTTSNVDVTSGSARDPDSGENCATPTLPAPLDGLGVGLACSTAAGAADGAPSALATGSLASVDLDGTVLSDLVAFLVDQVATPLATQIDAALEPLEEASGPLVEPVATPLAEQCQSGLEQLNELVLAPIFTELGNLAEQDPSGIVSTLTGPVADALQELGAALPQACADLLSLLTDLPSIQVVADTIRDGLEAALAELDLVDLVIGGSAASVVADAVDVTAVAEADGLTLELPAIGDLVEALDAIVADLVGELVGQVSDALSESFRDLVPTAQDLLQPVLDAIQLPDLLTATDPLLTLEVSPADARAVLDRDAVEVTSDGTASIGTVTLSDAFATLLGENTTIDVPAGQTQTILEGTPLESTLTLAATEEISREVDGMTLTGVRATGAGLELLTGVNGGISLTLSGAEAVVGGVEGEAPTPEEPEPPLPVTGGGLAGLGLMAVLGAALARRRP